MCMYADDLTLTAAAIRACMRTIWCCSRRQQYVHVCGRSNAHGGSNMCMYADDLTLTAAACGWAAGPSCVSPPTAATSSAQPATRGCWRTSPASAARGPLCRASWKHSVTLTHPSDGYDGVGHEACPISPFNRFIHRSTVSLSFNCFSVISLLVQPFLRSTVSPLYRFWFKHFLHSTVSATPTVSPFNRFSIQRFPRSTLFPFNRFSVQRFLRSTISTFNRFSVQIFSAIFKPFLRSTVSPFNPFHIQSFRIALTLP